jgi:hypothetical protein
MPYWDSGWSITPLGLAIDAFSTDVDVDRMLVDEPLSAARGCRATSPASRIACTS